MSAITNKPPGADISGDLLEAIESFPVVRESTHCGQPIRVSPFDIYATCPKCGSRVKLRSFSGVPEIEDIFDAVFAWMRRPEARRSAEERLQTLADEE